MKLLAHLSRIVVGIIFIFSGLIKLNDPVGTQIKLEEYFEVFAHDFSFMAGFWEALVPYALFFSIVLCSLEILAGVALLVQWKLRRTAWFLVLLCTFFAFLTFYSAYFNKVTDCGCFGEMIKLQPWTSFWKDIVLLVLLLVVLWQRAVFRDTRTTGIMLLAVLFCIGLGWYAVRYLPPYDGLAYAVGENIPNNMKNREPFRFKYRMEKDGKESEFDEYPSDTTYVFKEMIGPLNPDAGPRITDYRLWNGDTDYTQASFQGNHLFLIIQDVNKAHLGTLDEIKTLLKSLEGTGIQPAILTSSTEEDFNRFRHEHQLAVPYYFADFKVLKTIVRSNPGLWLLSKGTVRGKWSYASVPSKETILEKVTP
ncbi:BT_3928 family protein [Siphonobacter sp.]|uniref:BT_3928 family protein n=1 Tax=Siphonobacter sp. TaxID=1869184 RepID=UPI003B3B086A